MQELRQVHRRSRQHLACIVPNSGARPIGTSVEFGLPHQSALPWVTMLNFWPLLVGDRRQG